LGWLSATAGPPAEESAAEEPPLEAEFPPHRKDG
jgi:hypothetical protein